ncbi:hypothetical protein IV38_GL001832 [Lactobacillus selangorensis]|uniref:VOC domain-containing protein n=1 Tax=Lactobacillus selangorensis TaxID=81857 RepID=A0A0R2FRG9_9LACO|nr:VOC family protein [Lactobacillus selangorensis]KRN27991.1 hypothetical protein IV38_GL001832 [Lactobacillus selangorensis]KRN30538.1 hypothetical protein IV40_GL001723 [Lactobacillus selangorensis]
MQFEQLDHLTLTVTNLAASEHFYHDQLGLPLFHFENGRSAVRIGKQKLNFQVAAHPHPPVAAHPTSGSADFCLLLKDTTVHAMIAHCHRQQLSIEVGPVDRTGAQGPMTSIYLRDPDQNLVELSVLK